MDNLSHSVVGLALGELVQRSLPPEPDPQSQDLRRRMLLGTAWAASNFPDLDLVLAGTLPSPLGYLLHHRGHTHTLLYALPQAMLLMALVWLLSPGTRRLLRASGPARAGLLAATVIGLLLHIAMDYLNAYGIHPFYPFDAHWIYGDMVYILEPVFWVAFGVPLAMMVPMPLVRATLLGTLAAGLAWTVAKGFLHWGSPAALGACAIGLALFQQRAGDKGRHSLLAGIALALGFIAVQGWGSGAGKTMAAAEVARLDPAARVLDISMTAFPANPLCWIFVTVERNDTSSTYRIRRGTLSVAPSLMPVGACPPRLAEPPAVHSDAIGVAWESGGSLAGFRKLAENCRVQAWLRFARAPVFGAHAAADARFAMRGRGNFAALPLENIEKLPCPTGVPQWEMPRADLMQ